MMAQKTYNVEMVEYSRRPIELQTLHLVLTEFVRIIKIPKRLKNIDLKPLSESSDTESGILKTSKLNRSTLVNLLNANCPRLYSGCYFVNSDYKPVLEEAVNGVDGFKNKAKNMTKVAKSRGKFFIHQIDIHFQPFDPKDHDLYNKILETSLETLVEVRDALKAGDLDQYDHLKWKIRNLHKFFKGFHFNDIKTCTDKLRHKAAMLKSDIKSMGIEKAKQSLDLKIVDSLIEQFSRDVEISKTTTKEIKNAN